MKNFKLLLSIFITICLVACSNSSLSLNSIVTQTDAIVVETTEANTLSNQLDTPVSSENVELETSADKKEGGNDIDAEKIIPFTAELENGSIFDTANITKPVFLNIWTTWCGYCIQEMPAIDELAKEYEGKVEFILLDGGEEKQLVDKFITENFKDHSYKIAYDESGEVTAQLVPYGFPTTYLIKDDGTIKDMFMGAIDKAAYKRAIEDLIK